ncbi:MAG: hypothetical protein AB2L14_34010 [Candidatus Xenobiia bacterium LiM19]
MKQRILFLCTGNSVDYVVTLCDEASASRPFFPAQVKVFYRGFRDPAQADVSVSPQMGDLRSMWIK